MSAADLSVGYPVHAVATYRVRTNAHGARFVEWTAACSASGTNSGTPETAFGLSGSARKRELCPSCWPAGHATQHPTPRAL